VPVYSSVPGFLQAIEAAVGLAKASPEPRKPIEIHEDLDAKNTGFVINTVLYALPLGIWKQHYLTGPEASALARWRADLRKAGIGIEGTPKKIMQEVERADYPTFWEHILNDDDDWG
jgi:hypothetical protein